MGSVGWELLFYLLSSALDVSTIEFSMMAESLALVLIGTQYNRKSVVLYIH